MVHTLRLGDSRYWEIKKKKHLKQQWWVAASGVHFLIQPVSRVKIRPDRFLSIMVRWFGCDLQQLSLSFTSIRGMLCVCVPFHVVMGGAWVLTIADAASKLFVHRHSLVLPFHVALLWKQGQAGCAWFVCLTQLMYGLGFVSHRGQKMEALEKWNKDFIALKLLDKKTTAKQHGKTGTSIEVTIKYLSRLHLNFVNRMLIKLKFLS